ncbi:MAG TPA: ABC transporter transmembrane domain-containing protein, partial [Terriglobales bacterium]|nr:ABC transporter transmembrane domain-containing protein [Terriglobales bacterium]
MLRESRTCWPHLSAIAFLSFLSLPLTLLYPLPLKIVVDNVIGSQPLPHWLLGNVSWTNMHRTALAYAIFVLLGIAVLVNLQGLAAWWLQTYTGEKLVWDFRARLLNRVQRLPLVFHDHYGATDSVYRIQHDAPAIQYVTIQG